MSDRAPQYLLWQLAIAAFFLIAAVAGFPAPLVSDEVFSLETATQPASEMIGTLRSDVHPPLYYLLLKPWLQALTPNPISLRLFSAACLLLALSRFQRFLLRRGLASLDAWAGAALLAANPLVLLLSGYGRMYTLVLLFCVLTLESAFLALERPRSVVRFLGLASCVACGILTHNWFVFFLLALGVWMLLESGTRSFRLLPAGASGLALALLFWGGPLSAQLTSRAEQLSWLRQPGLGTLGDVAVAHGALLLFSSPLLFIAALRKRPDRLIGSPWIRSRAALAAFAAAVLVPFAVSQWKPVLNPRFTVIAAPFLALAIVPLLPRLGRSGALILAAVSASWAVGSALTVTPCNSRAAAAILAARTAPGDTVLFTRLSRKPVEWYQPGTHFNRSSFPAAIDDHPGYEGNWESHERLQQLRSEASSVTAALRKSPGSRVFVLADPSREPSRILLSQLAEDFGPPESVCLQCEQADRHYFSKLLVYRVRP